LKLLTKSTFYYLSFSILIILTGAILLYFTISKIVYRQIDNSLVTEKEIIRDQIEQTGTIPDFEASFSHQIEVRLLDEPLHPLDIIKDTVLVDPVTGRDLPYRHLFFAGNTSKKNGYSISLMQTLQEKNDLLKDISLYIFFLFLGLLITSIVMSYLISRKLWNPFHLAVREAEKYDIQSDKPINLPESNIKEFMQLNVVLKRMTSKMRSDYINLKEFNENAAHEIQTPLAIIRSKLELLMQKEELGKESLTLIKSIDEALTRLYKLNQGLLLISKIDNDGDDPATVRMSELLAEVLISNLISNAVRYNINGGFIKCQIKRGTLTISNSGMPLKSDPENLFRRFSKESDSPQSVGLGLSIVRKIVGEYNMKITYSYDKNVHELRLNF
jgi:signal transduction histidine kinase